MATDEHSNRALLSVAIRELITQLRNTILDYAHLHKGKSIIRHHDRRLLDATACPDLRRQTGIADLATRRLHVATH